MDSTAVTIFNQLMGQYNGGITLIEQGSIDIAKELFNVLATISVAVLGINRLLNRNVDAVETNIELIKLLIYFNVFYLFISQYDQLLPLIVTSFKAAGIYMGSKVSQYAVVSNPGDVINTGVTICSQLLSSIKNQNLFMNFAMSLVGVGAAAVVLFCFGRIAIELVLIEIGSRIILAAGIFLLAFSASQWTREYATRYINTFFIVGIKMCFIYLLVGLGGGLTKTWSTQLQNVSSGNTLELFIAIIMASFVYYSLCISVPDMAATYLTGNVSMNTGRGMGIGTAAVMAGAGLFAVGKTVMKGAEGIVGFTRSVNAANNSAINQTKKDGSDSNAFKTSFLAVKTLGSASAKTVVDDLKGQLENWDSKVNTTFGGRVAQKIKNQETTQNTSANTKEGTDEHKKPRPVS